MKANLGLAEPLICIFIFVRSVKSGRTSIAFDEGERVLIVSFLRKSLSRVLWTSPKGINRDTIRFQVLGTILDWLAGYVAQIASISCVNVFLTALS